MKKLIIEDQIPNLTTKKPNSENKEVQWKDIEMRVGHSVPENFKDLVEHLLAKNKELYKRLI